MGDYERICMVSTSKALEHCQGLAVELFRLGVTALSCVGTSQHGLRGEAVVVPGGLGAAPTGLAPGPVPSRRCTAVCT